MRGAYRWGFAANVGVVMGWTVGGAVAAVGKDGLEPNMLISVIEGARGRISMGRVVANVGDEGCDALAGVGDEPWDELNFATLETLAFTRMAGLVEALSGERRGEGDDGGVA